MILRGKEKRSDEEILELEEQEDPGSDSGEERIERVLFLNGTIAEESWYDDEVTPALFKEELMAGAAISRYGSTAPEGTAWPRPRFTTC